MILNHLRLRNFRSYDELDLDFGSGITAIVGENATGKTNLVEAIHYLSLARSFRTSESAPLIKDGASCTSIEADVQEGSLHRLIRIEVSKEGKRVFLNDKPLRKISELSDLINVIAFSPGDVSLFLGSPGERRDFLDVSLSKQSNDYLRLIIRYEALLRQRNALLKGIEPDRALLDVLTEQIVEVEEPIVSYRELYVANINRELPKLLARLRGREIPAELSYRPFQKSGPDFKERAKAAYKTAEESDLFRHSTGIGVHREDFSFRLCGKDISTHGSQGENRLAVLALKLCPFYLIEGEGRKPICVLDDITSELDEERVGNLFQVLHDFTQTFVTTTKLSIEGISYIDVSLNKAIRRNQNGR